jgi:hypothetical protein
MHIVSAIGLSILNFHNWFIKYTVLPHEIGILTLEKNLIDKSAI